MPQSLFQRLRTFTALLQIVGDNFSGNVNALRLLEEEFRELITGGDTVHCLDLLCEDIAKLQEIAEVLKGAKIVMTF